MRKDKKEIRNLLLGKMVLDEDGRLVTPPAGTFRVPQGVTDGAGSVRLFGITGKARRYETDLSEEAMMEAAAEAMRAGNMDGVKEALSPLLAGTEAGTLTRSLEGRL